MIYNTIRIMTDHINAMRYYKDLGDDYFYRKPFIANSCYTTYAYHLKEYFRISKFQNTPNTELYRQDNRPQMLKQATLGWNTNWNIHSIPYNQLVVVKERDDIPSLENPKFETTTQAKAWLADTEPIIVIKMNGACPIWS